MSDEEVIRQCRVLVWSFREAFVDNACRATHARSDMVLATATALDQLVEVLNLDEPSICREIGERHGIGIADYAVRP
jgi:hypothetical protein